MLRNIVLAVRAVFADVTVAPETDHTTAEFMRMRVKQTGITVTDDVIPVLSAASRSFGQMFVFQDRDVRLAAYGCMNYTDTTILQRTAQNVSSQH